MPSASRDPDELLARGWQPIETAPKDGRLIALWSVPGCARRSYAVIGAWTKSPWKCIGDKTPGPLGGWEFSEYAWDWYECKYPGEVWVDSESYFYEIENPKYWMPLPEPPHAK